MILCLTVCLGEGDGESGLLLREDWGPLRLLGLGFRFRHS
jgi:hypothetical protein